MSPHGVHMPDDVIEYADHVGALRQGTAFFKGRVPGNGLIGGFDAFLSIHRMGARCEAAAKLYLNPIRWHAFAERIKNLPDLGDFIDVKGRSHEHHGLIVQKDDEDDFAFLLVCAARHPDYEICGWLWGREAKQPQFWKDPQGGRAAYFIPPDRLHDPEELREIIHGGGR